MTATMVKMGDGFFIPKLEGFDDIKKDTITVTIDLAEDEHKSLSYKELKGIAIMERYYEKLSNQIEADDTVSEMQKRFRKNHTISMNLEEYLNGN